jgi:hypothetical protein
MVFRLFVFQWYHDDRNIASYYHSILSAPSNVISFLLSANWTRMILLPYVHNVQCLSGKSIMVVHVAARICGRMNTQFCKQTTLFRSVRCIRVQGLWSYKYGPRLPQCSVCYVLYCKGKAVPLQAWSGLEGSRKLRFPDFMTTAQDGGNVVSLTHRPPLSPGNTPGTHFC